MIFFPPQPKLKNKSEIERIRKQRRRKKDFFVICANQPSFLLFLGAVTPLAPPAAPPPAATEAADQKYKSVQTTLHSTCLRDREINEKNTKNQQYACVPPLLTTLGISVFFLFFVSPCRFTCCLEFLLFLCLVSFLFVSFVITVFCFYQFLNPPLLTLVIGFWSSSCSTLTQAHFPSRRSPSFLSGAPFNFMAEGWLSANRKPNQ